MRRRYPTHRRGARRRSRGLNPFRPGALLARLVALLPASEREGHVREVLTRCVEEILTAYKRHAVAGVVQMASGRVVGHVSVITESRQAAIVAMTAILHELNKEGDA